MSLQNLSKIGYYDLTVLLKSDINADDAAGFFRNLQSMASAEKLSIINAGYTGLIQAAYPIKKITHFHLYSLHMAIDVELVSYIKRKLNLLEIAPRYMLSKLENDFEPKYTLGENHKDGFARLIAQDQKFRDVVAEFVIQQKNT